MLCKERDGVTNGRKFPKFQDGARVLAVVCPIPFHAEGWADKVDLELDSPTYPGDGVCSRSLPSSFTAG